MLMRNDHTTRNIASYTDSEEFLDEIMCNNIRVINNGRGKFLYSSVFIDLNGGCNFRCSGCFKGMDVRQPKDGLKYDEVIAIINFAKEREARSVVYASLGEPTLDENFWKFLEYTRKKDMATVLFTNGTNITNARARLLYEKNASVIIKINTLNSDKQNVLVGGIKGAYEMIWRGLNNLLNAGFRAPRLAIDSYISRQNVQDLPELLRYCRRHDIIPYFESFITNGQNVFSDHVLSQEEFDRLFVAFSKIDRDEFNLKTTLTGGMRTYNNRPCTKYFTMFSVRVNGDVALCVSDGTIIGNIRKQALADILSPDSELIRNAYGSECRCSAVTSNEIENMLNQTERTLI